MSPTARTISSRFSASEIRFIVSCLVEATYTARPPPTAESERITMVRRVPIFMGIPAGEVGRERERAIGRNIK
jgi:hypothetical protein